jgi:hypothetical protein
MVKPLAVWERLKRRRAGLFLILGGIFFIIDQIGRIQTIADLYEAGKSWFAGRSDIYLPPHTLLAVGVIFVLLGLVSFFLPLTVEPKQVANSVPTLDAKRAAPPESVPHIDLIFDLPKSHATGPGWLVRDVQLKVVNTSDTVAYDVEIQPRETPLYKATFDTIARLEKGHPAYAVMDLRAKPSGAYYKDFEALLRFELENSNEDDDFKVRVPISVRFCDSQKRTVYQTAHEVVYDAFWNEAHIHLVQGTIPIERTPPFPDAVITTKAPEGVNKALVKHIMRGTEQQLMAWEITGQGFHGTHFLVGWIVPDQKPTFYETPDYKQANAQWHEWFKQWEKQPGGFGGAFGTGLDGKLPW